MQKDKHKIEKNTNIWMINWPRIHTETDEKYSTSLIIKILIKL